MSEAESEVSSPKRFLLAGVATALAASICCIGPIVLLSLGIGGAWISSLILFEPYRPIFIGLTFLFLGLAFYRVLYRTPNVRQGVSLFGCARSQTLASGLLDHSDSCSWPDRSPVAGREVKPKNERKK
jgi:hypothetical protein